MIVINNGAGACKEGTWEQAYNNIMSFIDDCEIDLEIMESNHIPEDGRYLFVLWNEEYGYKTEIEMPGLPLEQVRFMKEEGQNIWDFPRLYVDGGSWIWKFGLVRKEHIIEVLKEKIEESQREIENAKALIEKLES